MPPSFMCRMCWTRSYRKHDIETRRCAVCGYEDRFMQGDKHYVMVTRDDRFWLVGPFPDEDAAGVWGGDPDNNPEDDPRWQVIRLEDATLPVQIVDPMPL